MVVSRREKYIAIALAVTLGLVVVNWAVLSPLSEWGTQLSLDKASAEQKAREESLLFNRERESRRIWAGIVQSGLKSQPWEADSQLEHALSDWAAASGVRLNSVLPQRQGAKDGFIQLAFVASGTGTSAAIARLLWQIEQAAIPVRIEDFDVRGDSGGADNLTFHLTLSTLSAVRGGERSPKSDGQTPPLTVARSLGGGS